jgi:hypothetical protein
LREERSPEAGAKRSLINDLVTIPCIFSLFKSAISSYAHLAHTCAQKRRTPMKNTLRLALAAVVFAAVAPAALADPTGGVPTPFGDFKANTSTAFAEPTGGVPTPFGDFKSTTSAAGADPTGGVPTPFGGFKSAIAAISVVQII